MYSELNLDIWADRHALNAIRQCVFDELQKWAAKNRIQDLAIKETSFISNFNFPRQMIYFEHESRVIRILCCSNKHGEYLMLIEIGLNTELDWFEHCIFFDIIDPDFAKKAVSDLMLGLRVDVWNE